MNIDWDYFNREFTYKLLSDKQALKDFLLNPFLEILPADKHDDIKKYIDNLSENELYSFYFWVVEKMQKMDFSAKEIAEMQNEYIRSNKRSYADSILRSEEAKKVDAEKMKYIKEKISKSDASDKVYLTYAEDNILWNLAKQKDINSIPSDIIFSNQVPLKDIKISCDERGFIECGIVNNFRVIIFDDVLEKLPEKNLLESSLVGIMIIEIPGMISYKLYVPLYVENGFDYFGAKDYWREYSANLPKNIKEPVVTNDMLVQCFSEYLTTWYAIQISLLHPQIKTIYENPTKVPVKEQNKTKQKRKIKYIKVHKIKLNNIENIIYDDRKKINRKCLCWYVIGHWREYKNGKKVFIQGFWKGALRETKKNYDEGRERVIAKV